MDTRVQNFEGAQPISAISESKPVMYCARGGPSQILKGKRKHSKARGDSGGVVMDANKIVEMLTQVLASISTGGKVLPNESVENPNSKCSLRVNPTLVIMEAGYSALELDTFLAGDYYKESSSDYLAQLVHFVMASGYRLHLMKEWLSNGLSTKWHVIKAHILKHQLLFLRQLGPPSGYNTALSEHR